MIRIAVLLLGFLVTTCSCQNLEIVDLIPIHLSNIKNASENFEISEKCRFQMQQYHKGLLTFQLWAWQMFDAQTKFPTGLLAGSFYDLGNFDECLGISTSYVTGKYCLSTISLTTNIFEEILVNANSPGFGVVKEQVRNLGNDPKYTGFHFAACVPNFCTAKDVELMHPLVKYSEKYCYTKEAQSVLNEGAIVTIVILAILALLVVLSTSYDIFLHYTGILTSCDLTIAFSYLTHGRKLLSFTKNRNHLGCLNGFKAISMMWVILYHEYMSGASGPLQNSFDLGNLLRETANMYIMSATLAVDTFFIIGGLVLVYTFLKAEEKGAKFNIFIFYIHRYIRLTPALAIVVLIHVTLLKYFGDGPMWNSFDDHLIVACKKHWWAALLHIQNYVHDEQVCVPQTWYISVDFQIYLLSPLVLLSLKRWPKYTLFILFALGIIGCLIPFLIAYEEELFAFMITPKAETQRYIFYYYEQTYTRFTPYVNGMILGYLIYKVKSGELKVKFHKLTVLLLWIICLSGLLACIYAGHDTMLAKYNKWEHSLYIALNRPAWSIAISGIIFACITGYGGPINTFLSASIFQFISKLSYSIYLVHYPLILMRAASYKANVYLSHFTMSFNFWGDFAFSIALATILCLTFEYPAVAIEQYIFSNVRQKPNQGLKPNP